MGSFPQEFFQPLHNFRQLRDHLFGQRLCQLRFGLGTELDRCFSIAVEGFHNSFDLRRISFG
jgi:hypothetical protein